MSITDDDVYEKIILEQEDKEIQYRLLYLLSEMLSMFIYENLFRLLRGIQTQKEGV